MTHRFNTQFSTKTPAVILDLECQETKRTHLCHPLINQRVGEELGQVPRRRVALLPFHVNTERQAINTSPERLIDLTLLRSFAQGNGLDRSHDQIQVQPNAPIPNVIHIPVNPKLVNPIVATLYLP